MSKILKKMFIVDTIKPNSDSNVIHMISMGDLERIYKDHVKKYSGKHIVLDVVFDFDDQNDHDGLITIREEE